jgi:phenylacetate-CoA ligase
MTTVALGDSQGFNVANGQMTGIPKISLTVRERLTYSVIMPLRRPALRVLAHEVRDRIRWDRERIEELRLARLKEVFRAAARTPYYSALFRERCIDLNAVSSFELLTELPPLTRETVRERCGDMTDPQVGPRDWQAASTGGTTGVPVTVRLDKRSVQERLLVNHRMYALMGKTLGTPTLLLAGTPIDHRAWTSLQGALKNLSFGVTVRSSFDLTSHGIRHVLHELKRGKYRIVIAYASVLDLLADHAEPPLPPGLGLRVIPTAELVSAPQRERWLHRLGAETFEVYGSREMSSIAGETPDHYGLLVNGDLYHIEITDSSGAPVPTGQPGIITITALVERAMPMIRYQLGDVGRLMPPRPDDPYPFARLQVTHGRVLDVIRTPGGRMLPGEYFPHLMKEVAAQVQRFQVVQASLSKLLIRIVPTSAFNSDTHEYIRSRVALVMGRDVEVEIKLVERIEPSASGKYRPTISMVRSNAAFQNAEG